MVRTAGIRLSRMLDRETSETVKFALERRDCLCDEYDTIWKIKISHQLLDGQAKVFIRN